MLLGISKSRSLFNIKKNVAPVKYNLNLVKGYHSSSSVRINRDMLDNSSSAMHFMGPILSNPDTKKRFQDCSEIISSIIKYSSQKEKEVVQLAHIHRAAILRSLGKKELALQELYKVEKLGVESVLVNGETAKEFALLGQFGMGARYFSRIVNACKVGSEEYLFALDGRSYVYLQLYKSLKSSTENKDDPKLYLRKAQQDIDEAIDYAPNKYHSRLQKARVYAEFDNEVALEEINLVLEKAEDYPYLKEYALLLLMQNNVKTDTLLQTYDQADKLSFLEEDNPKRLKVNAIIKQLEETVPFLEEWRKKKQAGENVDEFQQKFSQEIANQPNYHKTKEHIIQELEEMVKLQ